MPIGTGCFVTEPHAVPPGQAFRSRFPDYDVLDKWSSPDWDDQTRAVVRRRVEQVPEIRFFSGAEARMLAAVADRIIPQPDRSERDRVPIVPFIDEQLFDDRRQGYRYADLPPQRDAWRLGLAAIDETARALFGGREFVALDPVQQDAVLHRIEAGDPPGAGWERLSPTRFFSTVLADAVVRVYYAHPAAWSETGYSGPSSPRGHVRLWIGGVDPWEAHEPARREEGE